VGGVNSPNRRPRLDIEPADVVARYERGDGMRKISEDLECSFGTVRRILRLQGVQPRPRGGARDQSNRRPEILPRARASAPHLSDSEVAKLRRSVGLIT
jgi:hypothetical protein